MEQGPVNPEVTEPHAQRARGSYRPELDGIRAIAVLAVLFYHVDAPWLPGGFVGVDVFFVLSGFLITGVLRRSMGGGRTFRYRDFFVRRVRRLSPALLFMTSCSCIAAWFLLLPDPMASFAESVRAQPVALQNMHFLVEGEYFHGATRKPLLHTWSLGVEEQFYLVWPFLLLLLTRRGRRWTTIGLTLVAFASFFLSLVLPVFSPKAAFFLFPARAWELALGGVLAVLQESGGARPRSSRGAVGLALVSLCALVWSFAWIDASMSFPGWVALLPAFGTAGLIAATTGAPSMVKRWLSVRPMVLVGLISYSLYLWHWPIIVFSRILGFEPSEPSTAALIFVASFLMAAISHRLVEEPIRRRRALKSPRSLVVGVSMVSVLLIAGATVAVKTKGLAFRYPEPARTMLTASFGAEGTDRCGFIFRATQPGNPICRVNESTAGDGILLWGNSHAAMWVGVVAELGEEAGRPVFLSARNCRATLDSQFCNQAYQRKVLAQIEREGISDVIIAGTWYGAYDRPDEELEEELDEIVGALADRGVRTWILVDVPGHPEFDPDRRYASAPDTPTYARLPYESVTGARVERERRLFQRLAARHADVHVVDPTDVLCPGGEFCLGGQDGVPWYRDSNHLTAQGARLMRARFEPIFE